MAKPKKATASVAKVQVETPLVPEQVTTDAPQVDPVESGFTIKVHNIGGYDRPEPCSQTVLVNGEITTINVNTESEQKQVLRNITQFNCLSGFIALIVITDEGE
jgi:hypothetical protein